MNLRNPSLECMPEIIEYIIKYTSITLDTRLTNKWRKEEYRSVDLYILIDNIFAFNETVISTNQSENYIIREIIYKLLTQSFTSVPIVSAFTDAWGWWRADNISGSPGSYVFIDKSSNGRNMTQAAGTLTPGTALNGQARVVGNATARLTSSATMKSWPLTVITIGRRAAGVACGFFGHIGATGYNTLWTGYESTNRYFTYNSSTQNDTTAEAGTDSCYITRIGWGSRVRILNGLILSDMTSASIAQSAEVAVTLGTEYRGLNFDWQETLVWNRTLTLVELDEVHTYINQRYGLTIPLWSSYTAADTIILRGQSNAAGRGDRGIANVNIPVEYRGALSNTLTWNASPANEALGTNWFTLDESTNNHMFGDSAPNWSLYIGPELTLCKEYIDRVGGNLYLYKFATGGSNLAYGAGAYWMPVQSLTAQGSSLNRFNISSREWWKSLRVHQQNSRKPVIKADIFYQGEQDCVLQADAQAWASNYQILRTETDREYGVSPQKIFIVRIHAAIDLGVQPYREIVRTQQSLAVAATPNSQLISVDSYTLRDNAHINVAGQLDLGLVLSNLI